MSNLCLIPLLLGQITGPGVAGAQPGDTQSQFPTFAPPRRMSSEMREPAPLPGYQSGQDMHAGPNVGQQVIHPATAAPPLASEAQQVNGSFSGREPLPLARKGQTSALLESGERAPPSLGGTIINIMSSLAVVLGLFFLVVWFMRRGAKSAGGALPSEVVQVLGRASLSPRQQLQLIRVGEKLVLVAVTASGAQTLTEVTNPDEVQRLASACEADRTGSATASFRETLSQLGNQPAIGGFFGGGESTRRQRSTAQRDQEEAHA